MVGLAVSGICLAILLFFAENAPTQLSPATLAAEPSGLAQTSVLSDTGGQKGSSLYEADWDVAIGTGERYPCLGEMPPTVTTAAARVMLPPVATATPTPSPYDIIQLTAGWNLISVPESQMHPSIGAVLANATAVTKVYTYVDGTWVHAYRTTEGWGGPLTQIVEGRAYFAYSSIPNAIILHRRPSEPANEPPSYSLSAGWSMIGFTSFSSTRPVNAYLGSLADKWTSLYRYDAARGWELAKPGGVGFTDMDAGRGYWVYLTVAGTLVP
ncbi:MAG: hypothetical protein ABIH46_01720 [Chloroflexota bacterium]